MVDSTLSQCPHCMLVGRTIEIQTVRALVTVSLRNLEPNGYRFCATPDCPIVYYHGATGSVINSGQIREMVYQKASTDDQALVCYCFQHTLGVLRLANAAQQALILKDIRTGIQEGQCACDLRNPQGRCCLGNVQHILQLPAADQLPRGQ